MGIGKTLSDVLEENRTNPNELSERTGIPPSTIYSIIRRDNMKVDISVLARICKELGVSMNRFYDEYFNEKENNENNIILNLDEKALIKKYRSLDDYGKKSVDHLLDLEYERHLKKNKLVTVYKAARSDNNKEQDGYTQFTQEQIDSLLNAPETDDDF